MSVASYGLLLLRIYLPVIMAGSSVLGFQKKKLVNLLKYFVIDLYLHVIESVVQNSLGIQIPDIILVLIYLYLSLFHYAYAAIFYDVFVSPIHEFLLEYLEQMNRKVQRKEGQAQIAKSTNEQMKLNWIQRQIYSIFKPENIFLLK